MGNMASPSTTRQLCLLSMLAILGRGARAQDASIAPLPQLPAWQHDSVMHLQLTAPESEALDLAYDVYPLTIAAGLNKTDESEIWIRGSLVPAEVLSADRLRRLETIAFLSCDGENATDEVNKLVDLRPTAILLYSVEENCCGLQGGDVANAAIFTMANAQEALDTLNNTIRAGGILRATIASSANMTHPQQPGSQSQQGGESAVAMSILYSITGLITLLFLVIIGMGAIKAHRYPERYGPRAGYGGRPPQSRAKGLARAVLETLPVVKFGDPNLAKPDPALELESQPTAPATTMLDSTMGTRLSAIPEEPRTPQVPPTPIGGAPMSGAVPSPGAAPAKEQNEQNAATGGGACSAATSRENTGIKVEGDNAACSICTEDFTVGEDVRVLPCDHKFHPSCIDPWLINVSGTCPLCRLDLNPHSPEPGRHSISGPDHPLPDRPPTSIGAGEESRDNHTSNSTSHPADLEQRQQRRRSFRFLGLTQNLIHASVEERIEVLRRHRSQQQLFEAEAAAEGATTTASATAPTDATTTITTTPTTSSTAAAAAAAVAPARSDAETEDQRRRRTRLADRLRERFHVGTRHHDTSAGQNETNSPSPHG
ncbi:hypothetical protein VTJ83DRAFT_6763 [Remersonia thermophila]|uniref:RING-type E3 ubiquitin transferase n=1 Tax=Remersonia thermophila TaxID=72144 RepID=A0ABR4D5P7_9PEZI